MTQDIGRGKSRLQKLKPQVHSVGTVITHRVFVGLQPVFLKNVESYKCVLDQTTVAHSEHHSEARQLGKRKKSPPSCGRCQSNILKRSRIFYFYPQNTKKNKMGKSAMHPNHPICQLFLSRALRTRLNANDPSRH